MKSLNTKAISYPLHEKFSWLAEPATAGRFGEFVELTRNICAGAELIAQAAKMDGLCRDAGQPTLLSLDNMETLQLMASDSLHMLADAAMRELDILNDRPRAEVKS
jgi:hypothetical protein